VTLTFMVFIASWACSMVSMVSHSFVCGRRSWLMICILSSEVLSEVRASGAVAAAIFDRDTAKRKPYPSGQRPLAKVRSCQFDDKFGYLARFGQNQRGLQNDQRQTERQHTCPLPLPRRPEGISRQESEISLRPGRQMSQSRGRE